MGKKSPNDRVWSLLWCLDDNEDVLKRSSTPNYMDFGTNLVKIEHRSPEIEKLESFEEDKQEFNERPRLQPRVVSGRRGRVQTVQHPQLPAVWSKLGPNRTQESRDRKTGEF